MTTTPPAPPVLRAASVPRPPADVFEVFTRDIGAWWPVRTHGVFGERSGGVRFTGSHLVETATDGTETTWAEVLAWEPPERLLLAWHPGREEGSPASRVEVRFLAEGDGTRVELRHDGWEQFGQDALRRRRHLVGPNAWGYVLDHLADVAEPREDVADLSALRAAYDAFFTTADRGGFGPPPDAEWDADQVIAHVALNDLAMTAVAHALVHACTPSFENRTCQDRGNLDALIARCGSRAELISFARECTRGAIAAVGRLGEEQLGEEVACRMEHDGEVVMEGARPWRQVAVDLQSAMHLPAHLEQLQDLRGPGGDRP